MASFQLSAVSLLLSLLLHPTPHPLPPPSLIYYLLLHFRQTFLINVLTLLFHTSSFSLFISSVFRLGDPEAQVLLPLLNGDTFKLMSACIEGCLDSIPFSVRGESSVCVVACAKGYPNKCVDGKVVSGISDAIRLSKSPYKQNVHIFHIGTALFRQSQVVTSGGRILSVTATGENLVEATQMCYAAISKIDFEGMFYRKDIAFEQVEREVAEVQENISATEPAPVNVERKYDEDSPKPNLCRVRSRAPSVSSVGALPTGSSPSRETSRRESAVKLIQVSVQSSLLEGACGRRFMERSSMCMIY